MEETHELRAAICGGEFMLRLLNSGDAAERSALLMRNAEFLAPFMPQAALLSVSVPQQTAILTRFAAEEAAGLRYPWGIFRPDGRTLCGWVNLNNVVRGVFQSADLGYALDQSVNGRGIMTVAVGAVVRMAFEALKMHRVQAAIMPFNAASQKVLERNDFERIGLSPQYLKINGRWEDHWLYARICPEPV